MQRFVADNAKKVGYLPHYLCKDLKNLLRYLKDSDTALILKVNPDAPAQFKIFYVS